MRNTKTSTGHQHPPHRRHQVVQRSHPLNLLDLVDPPGAFSRFPIGSQDSKTSKRRRRHLYDFNILGTRSLTARHRSQFHLQKTHQDDEKFPASLNILVEPCGYWVSLFVKGQPRKFARLEIVALEASKSI